MVGLPEDVSDGRAGAVVVVNRTVVGLDLFLGNIVVLDAVVHDLIESTRERPVVPRFEVEPVLASLLLLSLLYCLFCVYFAPFESVIIRGV